MVYYLCVSKANTGLVLCNPYLGQTKWIQPRNNSFDTCDRFALGYDNLRNHKILRICSRGHEIYDFSSQSWRFYYYSTPGWHIPSHQRGVSLKGNAYFLAEEEKTKTEEFLICFDFTTERFGPRLPLPREFHSYRSPNLTLSCLRDEHLAVLNYYQCITGVLEVWVTDKIDPSAVSWSMFLRSYDGFHINHRAGSFFIDEEKKVVVVFGLDENVFQPEACRHQAVHIYGQDGFFKSVNIGEAPNVAPKACVYIWPEYCIPLVCSSSFVPSLVQLPINHQPLEMKQIIVSLKSPFE